MVYFSITLFNLINAVTIFFNGLLKTLRSRFDVPKEAFLRCEWLILLSPSFEILKTILNNLLVGLILRDDNLKMPYHPVFLYEIRVKNSDSHILKSRIFQDAINLGGTQFSNKICNILKPIWFSVLRETKSW